MLLMGCYLSGSRTFIFVKSQFKYLLRTAGCCWVFSPFLWELKAKHIMRVGRGIMWILANSNRYVLECLHMCAWLFVHVCAFVFWEERVVTDRVESSQPISQHRCDIDLHRRWSGGMRELIGRQGWGQWEDERGHWLVEWRSLRGEKGLSGRGGGYSMMWVEEVEIVVDGSGGGVLGCVR